MVLFNWFIDVASRDYLSFNGTTLSFNESKLNLTVEDRGLAAGFNSTYNASYVPYSGATANVDLGANNITAGLGNQFGNASRYVGFNKYDLSGLGFGEYTTIRSVSDGIVGNATFVENTLAILGNLESTLLNAGNDATLSFTDASTLDSMKIGYNASLNKGYFLGANNYYFDNNVNVSNDVCIEGGNCLSDYVGFVTDNSSWNQTFANTLYSDIKWGYNMTDTKYWNISNNQLLAYNTTIPMNLTSGLIVTGNTNLSFETYVGDGTSYLGIINYGGMGASNDRLLF